MDRIGVAFFVLAIFLISVMAMLDRSLNKKRIEKLNARVQALEEEK